MLHLAAWASLAIVFAAGLAVADEPPARGPGGIRPGGIVAENRLAKERSPYLRQHRTNPVDWYPWGPEALERAKSEGKPLFVSVGYAACHWCHVMEHESFEDPGTARLLNDAFVCVKVDREERPDLDRVYMTAVQLITGRGGWPMTVLCLPDGRPFWGGTYLPRATLQDLVRRVKEAWRAQRPGLERQAETIAAHVRETSALPALPPTTAADEDLVAGVAPALEAVFDRAHGGYGARPKFPPHAELLFLTDRDGANGGETGLRQVRRTLEGMEEGGVHDQVGGGFHRYSTDERWLLPHFEKMLYDNALLAQAYARGARITKDARFARTARAILDGTRRDLGRPGGGYASSRDADTEGHEGLTYTWTLAELRAALPREDAELAIRVYGATEAGNFAEEATGRATGRNVLHLPSSLAEAAPRERLSLDALVARLDGIRRRLLDVRAKRPQPGLDDKVIVAWNGLMLSGLVAVGVALGDRAVLDEARRLAEFLVGSCRREDGTLLRFPRGSGPEIVGFAEDHVHVIEGLLDLADATSEARWADVARDLADRLLAEFEDKEGGGLWATSSRLHEPLFARAKEAWDSPIPSDQGAGARALLRLFARTRDERYKAAADRTLAAYRPLMAQAGAARGMTSLFRALAERRAVEAAGAAAAPATVGDVHLRQDMATVDAWFERGEVRRGGTVRFAVRVALDPGWHVNGSVPPSKDIASKDLVATSLALPPSSPVRLGEVVYPRGATHEGAFWIRGSVAAPEGVPAGPRRVALLLTLQPCDATSCRAPFEVRIEAPLRFADEDGPPRHAGVFAR